MRARNPTAPFAFVSITCSGGADWVVRYSTESFQEVGRAQVGEDPHLSLTRQNGHLYVPSQGSGVVLVLDRTTLEAVTGLAVPGAHGAGMTRHGGVFYTTNLPGGGADALFAIDTRTNSVIGAADAPETVPSGWPWVQ